MEYLFENSDTHPAYSFRYVVLMRLPLSLGSFKISVQRQIQLRQLLLVKCLFLDRYGYVGVRVPLLTPFLLAYVVIRLCAVPQCMHCVHVELVCA